MTAAVSPERTAVAGALAPARRKIGAIVQGYSPEQQAVLFDYFARAAEAYLEATTELQDKRTD
ncbi:hypothetical protein [Microbispora sp. NPDC049633]|uniref:hypothetical protein n=1 Tax=Microbispora sp. NPDC049633 TaxID=3154355 RepID=UPI00344162C6